MKKNLFKSFLYIFCAFCFLSVGLVSLHQNEKEYISLAEDVSSEKIENDTLPVYFSVNDKLKTGASISNSDALNPNSLINADTLLYFQEASTSNYLSISLLENGSQKKSDNTTNINTSGNEIYDHCFYPNPDDTSTFYFYKVTSINLFINGTNQNINQNSYVTETDYNFEGYPQLDQFEMIFSDAATNGNNFSIKDSYTGEINEGVYRVSLSFDLFTVTGSEQNLQETNVSDDSKTIDYYFYVLDRKHFFNQNNPNITYASFDKDIASSSASSAFSYYLYSNYSTNDSTTNKVPYIEYDYTRFEPTIVKSVNETTSTTKLLLDLDAYEAGEAPVVLSGSETITKIVIVDPSNDIHVCRVYFYDVGDYRVSLDAINLVENNGEYTKYVVDGISQKLKDFMVYVYGFQLKYTDVDLPLDQNGMRQTSEFKQYKLENNSLKILQSADITSSFLASNAYDQTTNPTGYSQSSASTTFLISNVLDYIQGTSNPVSPVQTNQTPLNFISNATLNEATNAYRYVFTTASTAQTNARYEATTHQLSGETLYRATFTGRVDSAVGKYIYFVPYTFNGYRSSASTLDTTKVFYQVFYFEITTGLPNVSIKTDETTPVAIANTEFTNKNVVITNNTVESPFNKDVTIQIYAWDFENNTYLSSFGGVMGRSFSSLDDNDDNNITLEDNAKYIIRLYYTHKATNTNINLKNSSSEQYYFRERSFTIDKTGISNIKARNVTEITNTTSYKISSELDYFSTNQNIVISWDEKKSGATTTAYYRYFALSQAQFYSTKSDVVSSTLSRWLNEKGNIFSHPELDSAMPVNYILDMNAENNKWIKYQGNTKDFNTTIESEYVFSDAGMYFVEIVDAAGNYTFDMFMIDTSVPCFAVYEQDSYQFKLTTSSTYITHPATLVWAKNKAIFMANLPNDPSPNLYSSDTIEDYLATKTDDFKNGLCLYQDYQNKLCVDIYKMLYENLFDSDDHQYHSFNGLNVTDSTDGIDSRIASNYGGFYVEIPIDSKSYFTDADHPDYTLQNDVYYQALTTNKAMVYRVLIRDRSNTTYDPSVPQDHINQYKDYCSAYQTIIISFDDSKFFVDYTVDGNTTILETNTRTMTEVESGKYNETIYLNPIRLNTVLNISFYPTTHSGEKNIQVESVVIKYYPYKTHNKDIGGKTYYYKEISDSPIEIPIYTYPNDPQQTTVLSQAINKDLGITAAGKYVLTRTYYTSAGYDYNDNDTYQKTYVLYVDRNEVIANTERVGDSDAHFESLVGGDIFVSMYDNKTNSDLVLSFPDSDNANSNSSSLYNNGINIKPVLTTNKLPTNIYVPAFKYTTHVLKTGGSNSYNFNVYENFTSKTYYVKTGVTNGVVSSGTTYYSDTACENFAGVLSSPIGVTAVSGSSIGAYSFEIIDTMNYHYESVPIPEYKLFATIYKFELDENSLPNSQADFKNYPNKIVACSNGNVQNGFLIFYQYNSSTKTITASRFENIKDSGRYYVVIDQGYYGVNETGFKSSNVFCFDVKSVDPDFEAQKQSGATLEYKENVDGKFTYFTNQSNVRLVWKAETQNSYMAEIDIEQIQFKTSKGVTIYATQDKYSEIFNENPKIEGENWIATISLAKLGMYENGEYVDITMQYKNHDLNYYKVVQKRIVVDLIAPSDNINNLVKIVTTNTSIGRLTESALRTYYTAENTTTTNVEEASYNYSNSIDNIFAYYSYSVAPNYLQTLKNSLSDSNLTSHYKTYIRKFVDGEGKNTKYVDGQTQETTQFLASNFEDIENLNSLDPNYYYEVIEMDRAGNMAIYTIYVSDRLTQDKELIKYSAPINGEVQECSFKTEDFDEAKQNDALNNIYSKTGFELKSINYFGDAWAEMEIKTFAPNGTMQRYLIMLSPWKNQVYSFVLSSSSLINLSALFDGSQSSTYKNSIKVLDKVESSQNNPVYENFYISVYNVDFYSRSSLSTVQNAEYIRFVQPNDNLIKSTTTASVYLKRIKISADGTEIYSKTNDLGLSTIWLGYNTPEEKVNIALTSNYLTFTLKENTAFAPNTRIVYEFEDNYGKVDKKIHLYQETIIEKEIDSEGDLYSYYDLNNGRLYYITKDGFKYTYNQNKYDYKLYEVQNGTIQTNRLIKTSIVGDERYTPISASDGPKANVETSTRNSIQTLTVKTSSTTRPYNDTFALQITDKQDRENLIQTIYFTLYNELPNGVVSGPTYGIGQFVVLDTNNNNITSSVIENTSGYFSKIKVLYSLADTFIPVVYSISTDKENWSILESGTILSSPTDETQTYYLKIWYDEKYLKNESSNAEYVFEIIPEVGQGPIYELNLSSLTSTYWIEKTIAGETTIVSKSSLIYRNQGAQYSNYYIVNVSYANKASIEIKTNDEQKISEKLVETIEDGDGVWTEVYEVRNTHLTPQQLGNIPMFSTTIAISYVPKSSTFVTEMFASDSDGRINESKNLIRETSETIVVSEGSSTDKLELRWTKYYGNQNEIKIDITKDSIKLNPTIYTQTIDTKIYSYIILDRSGKYSIKLKDSSDDPNIETFNYGNAGQTETFTLIFLKDVPFTVEYTDVLSTETKTSLPINEAVYNGQVKIKIDQTTLAEFYSDSGRPSLKKEDSDGNMSAVKRNGVAYTDYYQDGYDYIFTESGYYEITFSAISKLYGAGNIREQTYAFTILNGDEYKYSYVYNSYSNYYVKEILKNGVDVTEILTKTLNTKKISVMEGNTKKTYLSGIALSYLEEKTGAGTYVITINSNDDLLKNSTSPDSFTFMTKIKVGVAPLKISLTEGGETTSPISVAFNRSNIYKEMGECTLRIVRYENGRFYSYYSTKIDSNSTGEASTEITYSGTYYIQLLSPSENLLYSYKVIKNEPLNAAAIIAIVISAIAFIAIVLIIIKLRKRISVK